MKVKDALYQIGQLEKLEGNLEKVASVLFNNESLSNEVAEKAELSEEKPFFCCFQSERRSHWRN